MCQGVAAPLGTVFPCSAVLPLCGLSLQNGEVPYAGVSADSGGQGSGSSFVLLSSVLGLILCRLGGRACGVLRASTGIRVVTFLMDLQYSRNVLRSNRAFRGVFTAKLDRVRRFFIQGDSPSALLDSADGIRGASPILLPRSCQRVPPSSPFVLGSPTI